MTTVNPAIESYMAWKQSRWSAAEIAYFEAQPQRQISLTSGSPPIRGYVVKELTNLVLVRITEPGIHQYTLVYVWKHDIKD